MILLAVVHHLARETPRALFQVTPALLQIAQDAKEQQTCAVYLTLMKNLLPKVPTMILQQFRPVLISAKPQNLLHSVKISVMMWTSNKIKGIEKGKHYLPHEWKSKNITKLWLQAYLIHQGLSFRRSLRAKK